MNTVFLNSKLSDQERRQQLYQGQLFVFSSTESTRALCRFAREWAEWAFAPFDPPTAQFHLPVERYVEILAQLKPAFIHHPRCKELIRETLTELGCDLQFTYFDVPRLRTMTHGDYLTAGLAYAFHPHRDTWFSAPSAQVNWWLPVYDVQPENTMAFHPKYWNRPVRNSSRDYDYYRWNKESRGQAASQIAKDTRQQPHAEEPLDLESHIRLVCEAGALILFSGAYMHSTVRNSSETTRFSIDFRTVHLPDVLSHLGAPNVDSECTGTTLRDFMRGKDFERLPDEIAILYDNGSSEDGELVYTPKAPPVSNSVIPPG
jgi:hypothetical protein